jgi:inhibitor of KinA
MKLVPLGDQALLAYFADEPAAVEFAAKVRVASPAWLFDIVPAYTSVGVFFDPDRVRLSEVSAWLANRESEPSQWAPERLAPRTFHIPVCYELEHDLARVCTHTGLPPDDVIRLHTETEYRVYALGFVPGFPYLGYLPRELSGVGRLPSPRARVEPGSVAITGRQTAIYPLPSPGGWNLIGRTPLVIVDVAAGFFPLRVGDRIRFRPIGRAEFTRLDGDRLALQDDVSS